jgi:glycosyltransferase involved in cell wall biosynthesis
MPSLAGPKPARLGSALDPSRVSALVPCHRLPPDRSLIEQIRQAVGDVLVVDDGKPEREARILRGLAEEMGVAYLRLPENVGKGHAVAAGIRHLLSRRSPPQAVVVLDADGQHPPAAIPAFLAAAAEAELVIGDRFGDLAAMPGHRRLANRIASGLLARTTAQPVRDSQCGMRLLSGRALTDVPFPGGGYEAETRHLKLCLRRGVSVAWVPIPAIYEGSPSSFRAVRDSLRVLAALLR